jgi:hypothetical protein
MNVMSERILLPVVGLNFERPWDVGRVRFHPAGAAPGLIEAVRAGSQDAAALEPEYVSHLLKASARLSNYVVAEVSVSRTESVAVAETLVGSALAALNLLQHMENKPLVDSGAVMALLAQLMGNKPAFESGTHPALNPEQLMKNMPWLVAFQRFGLPGRAGTASYDFVNLSGGRSKPAGVPELGSRGVGAIMGVTTFGDDLYRTWTSDPVYRFIHEALELDEANRMRLQTRALLATELLSQAWWSDQPDVRLLNTAMGLEVLLAESSDNEKKTRVARRAAYLSCGSPNTGHSCAGRQGSGCPFLTLPLGGQGLRQLVRDARAGVVPGCSRFLEVLDIYEARNLIVHQGRYKPTIFEPRPDTRFIELALMRPALTWFSSHLAADLTELDNEIASQRLAPGQRAAKL